MPWYYKISFLKMGRWNMMPSDSEAWHTEYTAKYFYNLFGFGKGTWVIQDLATDTQHAYFPKYYFERLYSYIAKNTKRDYKFLENKLSTFYKFRQQAKKEIPKITAKNFAKLTNKQLIKLFLKNRDWAHKVAIYDQFGWTAEDYWNPIMEKILIERFKLKKDSAKYHEVMFKLIKPEEISTTLLEKRALLAQAILIKKGKSTIIKSAKLVCKNYGWMPVYSYGTPWDSKYYEDELSKLFKKDLNFLKEEYLLLKTYRQIRNSDIKKLVKEFKVKPIDLQVFFDFGLTLDARNEAEYLESLCGFYVIPFYKEMATRLYLSIKQLRNLYQHEIIAALEGKIDPLVVLEKKGDMVGWGFDRSMKKRFFFKPKEAKKFFDHLERKSLGLHGNDEHKGMCASPGKIQGKVIILNSSADNDKIKTGDILFAHATTVDYLPAMKRAAGFVTEVGSLTCHAAVVAREFGVPCIVGLKNATKNFKDGDMVELDAVNGLIKKL